MKNAQGIKIRLTLTVYYAFGFILGITSKNWWALPISLVATLVVSFTVFFLGKLLQIWGIGKQPDLSRQQRRALIRIKQKNEH